MQVEQQQIPKIVIQCVSQVEARGMTTEGIYRKSGPLSQINKLVASINKGENVSLAAEREGGEEGKYLYAFMHCIYF